MDLENNQMGPTDAAGLRQLYEMGDIHEFTFVWHEALPEWQPLKDQTGILSSGAAGAELSLSCTPHNCAGFL